MNCKNCNTRIHGRDKACPHCGRKPGFERAGPKARPPVPAHSKLAPGVVDKLALELDRVIESIVPEPELIPDPTEVRALLAARPELLEPGLALAQGTHEAVAGKTDVGEIDLLLVDEHGNLRVVMIPDFSDVDRALAEILPRMGWVARHWAKPGSRVRGIVLLREAPTETAYAAAAVSDSVSFQAYRMALQFDPIEP